MGAPPVAARLPAWAWHLLLLAAMIRVFGRLNGSTDAPAIFRVDQHGDPAAARQALVDEASEKLGVQPSVAPEHVKMYLEGGVPVSGVRDLEANDYVYFDFRGGSWQRPLPMAKKARTESPEPSARSEEEAPMSASRPALEPLPDHGLSSALAM